jgi:hypothetical protein
MRNFFMLALSIGYIRNYVSAVEGYVCPADISDTVVYLDLLPISCVETSDDGMFWAAVE